MSSSSSPSVPTLTLAHLYSQLILASAEQPTPPTHLLLDAETMGFLAPLLGRTALLTQHNVLLFHNVDDLAPSPVSISLDRVVVFVCGISGLQKLSRSRVLRFRRKSIRSVEVIVGGDGSNDSAESVAQYLVDLMRSQSIAAHSRSSATYSFGSVVRLVSRVEIVPVGCGFEIVDEWLGLASSSPPSSSVSRLEAALSSSTDKINQKVADLIEKILAWVVLCGSGASASAAATTSTSIRRRRNPHQSSETWPGRIFIDRRSKRCLKVAQEVLRRRMVSVKQQQQSKAPESTARRTAGRRGRRDTDSDLDVDVDVVSEVVRRRGQPIATTTSRRKQQQQRTRAAAAISGGGGLTGKVDNGMVMVIMDRRMDPVTPLLIQWTYQAMLHENVEGGIRRNIVKVRGPGTGLAEEEEEDEGEGDDEELVSSVPTDLVLTEDAFYQTNRFMNWGDLCRRVKIAFDRVVEQREAATTASTVDEIRDIVTNLQQYKLRERSMLAHVNLVSSLRERIKSRSLIQLSMVEQEIACIPDDDDVYQGIVELLENVNRPRVNAPQTTPSQLENLILLACLRFWSSDRPRCMGLVRRLSRERQRKRVLAIAEQCAGLIHPKLFPSKGLKGFFEKVVTAVTSVVESKNALTQHKPLIHHLLNELRSSSTLQAPFQAFGSRGGAAPARVRKVLLVIVGGVTYAESRIVHELNSAHFSVHLCGDEMYTSQDFRESF